MTDFRLAEEFGNKSLKTSFMFVTDTVMAIKICWNGSRSGPIMLNGNWKNETMNVDRVLPSILVETCLCVFQKV